MYKCTNIDVISNSYNVCYLCVNCANMALLTVHYPHIEIMLAAGSSHGLGTAVPGPKCLSKTKDSRVKNVNRCGSGTGLAYFSHNVVPAGYNRSLFYPVSSVETTVPANSGHHSVDINFSSVRSTPAIRPEFLERPIFKTQS